MRGKRGITTGVIAVLTLLFVGIFLPFQSVTGQSDSSGRITERLLASQPFTEISTSAPAIEKPDWYYDVVITYSVGKNGATSSDLGEFASLAAQTLNDPRGWSQLGVRFQQVSSGGMFTLILSQASLLPSYSSGCSAEWSCRVGNSVIINDSRWAQASASWNQAGGSLRDYRHMVINHEVGHWLGHDHRSCPAPGQPAPLMQQQSIDLQGCTFNPWPLANELWSSRI